MLDQTDSASSTRDREDDRSGSLLVVFCLFGGPLPRSYRETRWPTYALERIREGSAVPPAIVPPARASSRALGRLPLSLRNRQDGRLTG